MAPPEKSYVGNYWKCTACRQTHRGITFCGWRPEAPLRWRALTRGRQPGLTVMVKEGGKGVLLPSSPGARSTPRAISRQVEFFVSSLSAAFPHPPGLLSLGAGAPRDGTPPFQACPRNLLPPPCPDPSQKPLLLQCSPLRLRFIILREHLGHSRKRFDLTLRCCDSVALEQALDIGALKSTTGDPSPHRG